MSPHSTSHTSTPGLGFLGATSYKADLIDDDNDIDPNRTNYPTNQSATKGDSAVCLYPPNRASQVQKGSKLIWLLHDMPIFERYIRQAYHPTHSCTQVMRWVMPCLASIRNEIATPLANLRVADQETWLLQCSERIFQNSLHAIELAGCPMDEYVAQITGANLRWETIGMLFTAVGLAAMAVTGEEVDHLRKGPTTTHQSPRLAREMLEAGDACLAFCEELGFLTDPEMWLVFDNYILCSLVEGDASEYLNTRERLSADVVPGYLTWRRLGNVVSAAVAAGLHAEIKASSKCPFWMTEIRKTVAGSIYCQDKSISSFLGRPPRLLRKYCAMQLPVDIDSDQLRRPESELAALIAKTTDAQGWNLEPKYRPTLSTRCMMLCYMIREDILELTGAIEPHDEFAFLKDLVQRSADIFASLPYYVRNAALRPRGTSIGDFKMADVLLQFKFNDFLLQRAVVKRFQWSNDELIRVSSEIVGCVLNMTEQIGAMGIFAVDVPWMIAEYALPTAGVLSLELLRQSQGKTNTPATFNRSEVVQALSGLVSALKWAICSQDGNYEICKQARHVLLRILDRVLDPLPTVLANNPDGLIVGVHAADGDSWGYDWLNGVRSESEFWTNLPNHPLLREAKD